MNKSLVWALLALFSMPACAGWLDDAVQNAVKRAGARAVDESSDALYRGAKNAATKPSEPENNSSANTGGSSNAATGTPSNASENVPGDSTAAAGNGGNAPAPEVAYNKFDFIPGDKVIFFDDFSDTEVGEFPRKWTLEGERGGGASLEVVQYAGQHYLLADSGRDTYLYLRLNRKGDLPEKFTVEFDALLYDQKKDSELLYKLLLGGWTSNHSVYIAGNEAGSEHSHIYLDYAKNKDSKVHHISISVNGRFVKAYVDNIRVINDPEAISRPIESFGMNLYAYHGGSPMFSNFRYAEGGKNIKSAIDTDGKIVTHGILFDVGSDKIRPESAATLNKILGLLNDTPELKFSIEGHTDNQGSATTNQPLSEKRAVAIKNWLVGKGIDADRLQTKGWGQSKPIDSNTSKEGQANNRRVEFIKVT